MSGGGNPRFDDPVAPPPEGVPWSVLHLLRWSTAYLRGKGIPEPRLDAEYLLADTLERSRLELYLDFERPLAVEELAAFRGRLLDRGRRKPVQYILGRTPFRELELRTDPRVLIPRPETEELVGAVLDRVREWGREGLLVLDIGTGSGAIALSLALEGPFGRVVATDLSLEALEVARENAGAAGVSEKVEFREGSLFSPVGSGERFDVIVSNPPYIGEGEFAALAPEVRDWEPEMALLAADRGMALIESIVRGAGSHLEVGGLLALEIGAGQGEEVLALVRATEGFGAPILLRDLSRRDRMILTPWLG